MALKTVNPAVLVPLQEALATAYWYKPDLRAFLSSATGLPELVNRYDWNDKDTTKRQIVRHFVMTLFGEQHAYQDALIALLVATPDIDPSPLKRLDDGAKKHAAAVSALSELRALIGPYRKLHSKAAEAEQRFRLDRDEARRKQERAAHIIADLKMKFIEMHALAPQARGYALERFMTRLFDVHDIDARGPFTGDGEQIDGAFTFDGADYLLEAKWQQELTSNPDLSIFRDKVRRRLEQLTIPKIAAKEELLREIASDEWWVDVTVRMLEQARRELRTIVALLEKTKRDPVYTDFRDTLGDVTEVEMPALRSGTDTERFTAKVRDYLRRQPDNLALQKLRTGKPLTAADLASLEALLAASGTGEPADLNRAIAAAHGLGRFIRSLVGLDRQAAVDAFAEFLDGRTATASQIDLVNLVISHLTRHGEMDPDLLFEPPFTDNAPHGPTQILGHEPTQRLVRTIRRLNAAAEPKTA